MKRDMDLCRQILLDIEGSPEANGLGFIELGFEGKTQTEVSYHVHLLKEAGLLEASDLSNSVDGLLWFPNRLTYAGHEFIEATRSETVWTKAKSTVLEKTGGLSLGVLKSVAIKLVTDLVL